ncbi:unnamed protein product [Owenia fusiformis]|uniref:Profilin n=1 Tax=Owenia fusiformis TaxID=6347 RepID=A0A8J1YBM7_OWEFU|nr:unnamed protein product [Owenia fusiformis]
MSWSSYIDNLIASGHVEKAAIHGHDGNVWATSPDFTCSQAEVATLNGAVSNPETLRTTGIHLNGKKYMFIKADDNVLIGKQGNTGCSVAKCKQCIVIAVYNDKMQPGACNTATTKIADYLISSNY